MELKCSERSWGHGALPAWVPENLQEAVVFPGFVVVNGFRIGFEVLKARRVRVLVMGYHGFGVALFHRQSRLRIPR